MEQVEDTKQVVMQELVTGKRKLGGFSMEWSEKTFEELFDFLSTGTNSRSDLSLYGDVGYIHYGDIHSKWNQFLDCDVEELPKIDKQKVKNLPFLKEGDLILADASEDYVGIGACILLKNVKTRKIVSGLHTILLRSDNTKLSPAYSVYLTSIRDVKDQLISITTGISVYGLPKNQLKKIKVYLPNDIKEQTAIAQILSDTDDLIQQLDHLIIKKKNIKQGAMQELLTGKRRLKGFNEKWDIRPFGSLTTLLTNGFVGKAKNHYVKSDDGILYIQGYNVDENNFNYHGIKRVSHSFHKHHQKSSLRLGDLLTIQTGDIGVTALVPKALVGANCHALIISRLKKNESDPRFYCQYFNSAKGRSMFKEIETGTTMKHLNVGDLENLLVPFPQHEEQSMIAQILSDMDWELTELQKKRDKFIMIKNGMMQKLLTGEIRLV